MQYLQRHYHYINEKVNKSIIISFEFRLIETAGVQLRDDQGRHQLMKLQKMKLQVSLSFLTFERYLKMYLNNQLENMLCDV